MNSSDREGFNAQVALLCGAFNVPVTEERLEGLWVGLRQMNLIAFTRVVEHAVGPSGSPKFPTSRECWNIYRELKTASRPHTPPADTQAAQYDHFHGFAQRALMVFLQQRGAASAESLDRLIAEKNRIVSDFRLIATEDVVTADEFREALFKALGRVFAEASSSEVEAARERSCRERGLRFVSRAA